MSTVFFLSVAGLLLTRVQSWCR